MKFSMDFIEVTPLPIFMMALEKQKGSNIASKVTVSVPSEVSGRIPVFSGHVEMEYKHSSFQ